MSASHKTEFLGTQPIFSLLIKMSVPAAVGMIVNALYNIVDTIFVGQGVGPLAIAALSIVFPIQMIVSAFAQALSTGAASIASRRLGEKNVESAAKAVGTAYAGVSIVTFFFVILVFTCMQPILIFFGAGPNILPYAVEYMEVVSAGFFFFSLSMCASNLIRAEGNARAAMRGMLIGAVLNTILDPIFIFGFDMGVRGAAIATVISQIGSCLYLFSFYFRKKASIPVKRSHLMIDRRILSESIILGIPSFVQSAGMSILQLIVNNSLAFYGGDQAIAIYGMVHRLNSIIILPIIGMAMGFQPIAGYNYGARQFQRVRASLRVAILTTFCLALVGFAFVMVAPKLCISLFVRDAALIASGATVLRIMVSFIPLAAVQIIGSTYFQSIGKPIESLILGISRQFLILIPLVVIMPRLFSLNGIWLSFPMSDFLATTLTTFLLLREVRHLENRTTQKTLAEVAD